MAKEELKLSAKDVELLNSKIGLKRLLAIPKTDVAGALKATKHEQKLRKMQADLITLQNWTIKTGQRVIIVFEGRDAAGKGGAIRRITAHINPRHFRIVALPKPTEDEKGQWYFQRYVSMLPEPGEIVFFDRSWYNRAIVEPVNGFCTEAEYEVFMGQVNEFERMIVESGAHLIKFYFSISKAEQAARFKEIASSPLKRWKMTAVDREAQDLWTEYTRYKDRMFEMTDVPDSPWVVINANGKANARIAALKHILETIPYEDVGQP
jgi:polyphosphate kinase 2